MPIYTRTGDTGETALFGGPRVRKDHHRVAAYGVVDELNAALGVVMAAAPEAPVPLLTAIQRDLFAIGGQLASPDPERVAAALEKAALDDDRIHALETAIDDADRTLPALRAFVLPGGTLEAALLHQARTTCRRAERAVVHLAAEATVPPIVITYLNRLSDLLFILARAANHRARIADRTW